MHKSANETTPLVSSNWSRDWSVVGSLIILAVVGLGLRVTNLGAIGFAEDEVNKVNAVRAYERGDIAANGEHPMLMKVLMFVSVKAGRRLAAQASDEALFRLPNAIVGALTVIPLFLLTAAFFDRWTAMLAAAFWSVGVNAITFNRIGKEDTLLVFFMLFAFYFYLRAKQTSPLNLPLRRRNYLLSGVSFGLMLASKYFPHYLGLNSLYHQYFRVRKRVAGEPAGSTSLVFYVALVAAFLIANPAVLLPQVWEYLIAFIGEQLLHHSGYLFGDRLYMNTLSSTPFWGTPVYFYLVFIAFKIPLPVLASFIAGCAISIRRWRHAGHAFALFMFLFWIVPYSLIGGKWLRYTLSLMPFVYILSAVGTIELVRFIADHFNATRRGRAVVAAAAVLLFIGLPAWTASSAGPHYALYTNVLGSRYVGYFFPHDEFYDDGLREAIRFVGDTAPPGALIAHETPAATRYYLEKFGRTDLVSKAISAPDFEVANISGPAYIIIQRGRTYFENREKIAVVRATFVRVHEVQVNGLTAAEVFVTRTRSR